MRIVPTILLLLAGCALFGADRGMTLEDITRLKSVGDAVLSPSGDMIAYTLNVPRNPFTEDDGPSRTELHLWDAARGSRPFITGKVKIGNVQWTPDGMISFTTKRGEDKETTLYVIPVDGGEARQLLAHDTGISSYNWSKDGRLVFLTSGPKDKDADKMKDKGFKQYAYEEEPSEVQMWVVTFDGSDEPKKEQIEVKDGHLLDATWSPDGKKLALVKSSTSLIDDIIMNSKIHVVDTDGKELMKSENPGKLSMLAWSPDSANVAYMAGADRNDPSDARLYVTSVKDNKTRRFFMEDKGDVNHIAWKDAQTIVYLWDEGVDTSVRTLNLSDGKAAQTLEGKMPTFPGLSIATGAKKMALVGDSPSHPGEVYLWEEGNTSAKRVTNSNPWLAELSLAPQGVVNYKARDGLELQGLLIRPLNEEKGKTYPMIMVVHGGPEAHIRNGWLTSYARPGQAAAAQGYAVFYPNYRASTGRGVAFSKLDHGRPAMEQFDDLVDAITHLSDNMGLVDKKRVGITGGSYGGYATAWGATALSEHFAAGVMSVGISNKISKSGTSDIPEELFLVHDRKRLWDDWQLFLEASPIYHVQKAKTPLLIMHGEEDTRVHPSQSMELYRHLKTLGKVPVRLVFYPGEGHGNRKAAARYDFSLRMMRWMNHYLQGPGGEKPPVELDYPLAPEKKEKSAKP